MSTATLPAIRTAILGALAPLRAPAGPFRLVDDWAGELANVQDNLSQAVLNQSPALLVAFAGEASSTVGAATLSGNGETVGVSSWLAIVVTTDARPVAAAVGATAGVDGVLALAERVQGALNALRVDGLYRTRHLEFADARWFAVARGSLYALAVRFTATRALARATQAHGEAPLEEIHADEDAGDGSATDGDPIVQFVANTAT